MAIGPVPPLGLNGLGSSCPPCKRACACWASGLSGINLKLVNQFGCLLHIACTLYQAGNRNVFCHRLSLVAVMLMRQSQARMCEHVLGFEHGHTHPIFDGFVHIALIEI